jgi:hypothetical protein
MSATPFSLSQYEWHTSISTHSDVEGGAPKHLAPLSLIRMWHPLKDSYLEYVSRGLFMKNVFQKSYKKITPRLSVVRWVGPGPKIGPWTTRRVQLQSRLVAHDIYTPPMSRAGWLHVEIPGRNQPAGRNLLDRDHINLQFLSVISLWAPRTAVQCSLLLSKALFKLNARIWLVFWLMHCSCKFCCPFHTPPIGPSGFRPLCRVHGMQGCS